MCRMDFRGENESGEIKLLILADEVMAWKRGGGGGEEGVQGRSGSWNRQGLVIVVRGQG